jgi:CheY-like chemotaxis protein
MACKSPTTAKGKAFMRNNPIHILLVEDDEVDAEVVQRAFQQQQISHPLTRAIDGMEALQMLRGEEGYPCLLQPYLILLDINLPRMNGIEFLQTLRRDVNLRQSIVFVLTTSNREEDKIAAYDEQIAGYFLKSGKNEEFSTFINLLDTYTKLIEFPPENINPNYS